MAKDRVCGMEVDSKQAAGQSQSQGQIYYFCSTGCKREFDQYPQKFVGKQESARWQHGGHEM